MTRFILINTSHPGNVGAAARAMKVMGFGELVLVKPRFADVLSQEETVALASGAADTLTRARIVETLEEALDGVTYACATAMTPRDFGPPVREPRALFAELAALPFESSHKLGLVFGSERYGMSNEDVYRCHAVLISHGHYDHLDLPSLRALHARWQPQIVTGLGHAELLAKSGIPGAVELNWGEAATLPSGHRATYLPMRHFSARGIRDRARSLWGGFAVEARTQDPNLADAQAVQGLLTHWQASLEQIGFLDPAAPRKLMPRLNQLFNRAQLTVEEVHILRGIARQMTKAPRSAD